MKFNNDNGVRVVKFIALRNLVVKATRFLHHSMNECKWGGHITDPCTTTIS
jgi:hypothetical protein